EAIKLAAQNRAAQRPQSVAQLARIGVFCGGLGNRRQLLPQFAPEHRGVVRPGAGRRGGVVSDGGAAPDPALIEPRAGEGWRREMDRVDGIEFLRSVQTLGVVSVESFGVELID